MAGLPSSAGLQQSPPHHAPQVESLTAARQGGGSEPSDTIRAVNALLTQLDQLRGHPNAMARHHIVWAYPAFHKRMRGSRPCMRMSGSE